MNANTLVIEDVILMPIHWL